MTESDPYKRSLHEPGAKADSGKQRTELVLGDFARALSAVADVGTFGANKYSAHGWLSVPRALERYADAAGRHRLKRQMGEAFDPESDLLHLAHEAWNILAILELTLRPNDEIPEEPTQL